MMAQRYYMWPLDIIALTSGSAFDKVLKVLIKICLWKTIRNFILLGFRLNFFQRYFQLSPSLYQILIIKVNP